MATGLIVVGSACDTNQPADAGTQVISVRTEAFALTSVEQIFDIWEDIDLDGTPDVDTGDVRCVPTAQLVNVSVPWPFSASFSLVRAGSTIEITIASTATDPDPFSNITPYDDDIRRTLANLPAQGKCQGGTNNGLFCTTSATCPGGTCGPRVFHFLQGREITSAHREFIDRCTNFGALVADANILGQVGTFDFNVQQGDTIVFRARKQLTVDAFPYDQFLALNSQVFMASTFFIDGIAVAADGDSSSSGDQGDGYTASVRLR